MLDPCLQSGVAGNEGAANRFGSTPIDGDMPPAAASERLLLPSAPAVREAEPSDPRHEVEFARPGVAVHDRGEPHAFPGEDDVAFVQDLGDGIVAADVQPHLVDLD